MEQEQLGQHLSYDPCDEVTVAAELFVILQMKRFMWDDHKRQLDKDAKQTTKKKLDDFPALLRYLANWEPTSHSLLYQPSRHVAQRNVSHAGSAPWANGHTVR